MSERPSPPAPPANVWDPLAAHNAVPVRPAAPTALHCTARVRRDVAAMAKDPPPGVHVAPDDEDITVVHALIVGCDGTPYEGGFFYFLVRFSPEYPITPPLIKLMTTDGGKVRFNPNIYRNGKVCLSILGTWDGPSWSPSMSLMTVLVSIQSMLNERPYHNEPGYESAEKWEGDSDRYNEIIHHETLRVAVCGMLENDTALTMPDTLRDTMEALFLVNYERYRTVAQSRIKQEGRQMASPFPQSEREVARFRYVDIVARLKRIRDKMATDILNDANAVLDAVPASVPEGGEGLQVGEGSPVGEAAVITREAREENVDTGTKQTAKEAVDVVDSDPEVYESGTSTDELGSVRSDLTVRSDPSREEEYECGNTSEVGGDCCGREMTMGDTAGGESDLDAVPASVPEGGEGSMVGGAAVITRQAREENGDTDKKHRAKEPEVYESGTSTVDLNTKLGRIRSDLTVRSNVTRDEKYESESTHSIGGRSQWEEYECGESDGEGEASEGEKIEDQEFVADGELDVVEEEEDPYAEYCPLHRIM